MSILQWHQRARMVGHQEALSGRLRTPALARTIANTSRAGRGQRPWPRTDLLYRHVHLRPMSMGRMVGQSIRMFRLPIGLASLLAGAMTYASYKLNQLGQGLSGLWASVSETAGETLAEAYLYAKSFEETARGWAHGASGWAHSSGNEARDTAQRAKEGFDDWWTAVKSQWQGSGDSSGGSSGHGPERPAAAAAAAVSVGSTWSSNDEANELTNTPSDNTPLMLLTRKLIEIRNILLELEEQDADQAGASRSLRLPSIVVIGSQSSGKSSVLEAIVGHEFLPKGDNMVTRRPIELTLVHETGQREEFGVFPQLGGAKMTSFRDIQRTLLEQNLAVSDEECVSAEPILLQIYSPNVPDLTLIDLPGYIQISSLHQPEELKSKIEDLCQTYIKEPNIILAVCSADVDLANSPALKASRKVDPLGLRTMGVITKMDLVEPAKGISILTNRKYPLHLGYVGVISKATDGMKSSGVNMTELVVRQEEKYFNLYPEYLQAGEEQQLDPVTLRNSSKSPKVDVGVARLRKKLMVVLEESMSRSLTGIANNVARELEEARYQFKVQYNDRTMTAETYVAETMDKVKTRFKELATRFSKAQVRTMLKQAFDQQVMDILAAMYWIDPRIAELSTLPKKSGGGNFAEDLHWEHRLEASTSSLTKSGVGRKSTQIVVEKLRQEIEALTVADPLPFHPETATKIQDAALDILTNRFHQTADQVENCVKPYKYQVDLEPHEWDSSVKESEKLIRTEIEMCERSLNGLNALIGHRKLSSAMKYVADREQRLQSRLGHEAQEDDLLRPTFNPQLLHKAREALLTQNRLSVLKSRLGVVRSKMCRQFKAEESHLQFDSTHQRPQSIHCPEVFLNAVEDKLALTAVMFIHLELLSEFFYQFPRELEQQMFHEMDKSQLTAFARQNPAVRKHLDLQERKDKLELASPL